MLKAKAGEVVLFGLSARNMQLLREGRPIKINMADLGLTGTIVIFYGEDEAKMRREMADLIGPDTIYTDSTTKDG